jgi:hypothetical protein
MANTYLTRTFSSGNRKTYTQSFWVKLMGGVGAMGVACRTSDNTSYNIYLNGNSNIDWFVQASGGWTGRLTTNRKFRDPNAWYHIVGVVDTTQSTASDRIKLYVNGVQETSFSTATYPSINTDTPMNDSSNNYFVGSARSTDGYLNGCYSHFHFCDGYAYAPTEFGETDSTTGEWKIKTSPSVTYGNNGFFILKDGNSVTDQSGNGNNFTVGGGTLTKTEDNPSNVFATLNPLSSVGTFSYGNTEVEYGSGTGYQTTTTTLGMTSGKYYCEAKITFDGNYPGFGIAATNSLQATVLGDDWLGEHSDSYGYYLSGTIYNNGSAIATGQSTFATNDIIGMALDLDSAQNTLKFYKNGSLINTTNITTNSNGWFFGTSHVNNKTSARSKFNFGNGYFRSDAVSSAGTNASNIGIFEYDVPTGYTALSTKGLNL